MPSLSIKASCGMLAGAVGAFIGTPAEVCLIRMTADGRLPPVERRNYKNVFNALARIINEEGITTLFRGFAPTVARGIVVNGIMLSTYSQVRYHFFHISKFQYCIETIYIRRRNKF